MASDGLRSSPFLFSLLVSASPVLICTAVLLGTLLCFGDPQIPDFDKSFSAIPLQNHATNIFNDDAVLFPRHDPNTENIGGLSSWRSREINFDQHSVNESSNEYTRLAFEATTSMDDHFEPCSLPWTQVNGDDDEEEEEYEPLDSGSDGAESSSPETSMADIIPLLNEIDPLIKCETSGLLSTCNRSHNSYKSGVNSDEEADNKEAEEEEEEEEEEAENDDDEEENQANKEDAEESAIKWTENDQKNLMDLGSSELERNQRLESLIARRRARLSMNERNLIDLDGNGIDLPNFQVLSISTTRQNPFDFPNETYDDKGLPPVPGSAPSILLPRRNPFDLPYDSSEEKPDLTGDSFHQEFMQQNHKEPFPRKDGRVTRLRPYFVADRLASEGTSYSPFLRQSSEVSESSSSYQRQSSDVSESKASSAAEIEQVCVEEIVTESEIDQGSVYVEHGSQSSQILDDQCGVRDFDLRMPEIRLGESQTNNSTSFNQAVISLGSSGNDPNIETWLATNLDVELMESLVEEDHDTSSSSSSSLSLEEEEENIDVKERDAFVEIYDSITLETIEEEHISSSSSSVVSEEENNMADIKPEISDAPIHTIDLDDTHFEEPVYDSSPRGSKFAESDVEQERDGFLGKKDGDNDHQEVSDQSIDANKLHSSSVEVDLVSLGNEVSEEPKLVNEDAVLSMEKLISVAHEAYSLEDDGLTNPNPTDSQKFYSDAAIYMNSFDQSEKTRLQVEEPESSEIIDKPSLDVAFINRTAEITDPLLLLDKFTDKLLIEETESPIISGEGETIHGNASLVEKDDSIVETRLLKDSQDSF
ncbi:hypothetical protein V2J09_000192 [Rumex salicifolius]